MKSVRALLGILVLTGSTWSQDAGVNRPKHDVNGQGCTSCHVDRTPSAAPQSTCDKTPLWDCELPSRIFQTYDASEKAGSGTPGIDDTQVRMSSMLCASCHDGVGTPSMSGAPRFNNHTGSPAAKGLQSEHPINVPHDPTRDATLAALTSVTSQVKLFGHANTVQCSTCHDPHDSRSSKLLRTPNEDSALCLICHL